MSNSINTNIAAYYAQANINSASNAASSSVARLSSGNRIVQASDDVAALATGTSLQTQVSALKTALGNASQGTSLLQVADGALAQIQTILQQQQSLALQASSGALTNTERSFLNQQFQALTAQIDSLATGTNFNGVSLIDGSISAAGTVGSTNPLINKSADTITSTQLASAFAGSAAAAYLPTSGNGDVNFSGFTTANTANKFGAITINKPASGANDAALYGDLSVGASPHAAVTAAPTSGTIDGTGGSTATTYTVTYKLNNVTYSGTLALDAAADGTVAAYTPLTLTATSNPSDHSTISLSVGSAGFTTTGDNSSTIVTALTTVFGSGVGYSGSFDTTTISHPSVDTSTYDSALYGDLSKGAFNIYASASKGVAGTIGTGGTALGYTIEYNLNGVTYQGYIDNASPTAGSGILSSGRTVALTSTVDPTLHSSINLTVGSHDFGVSASVDQSANLKKALETNFASANLLSTNSSAVISGTTSTSGITAITAVNNIGKNDTALVGDLSTGVFNVTGSNSSGFNVSYTINGSTYQGSLSAADADAGHKLVLTNGNGSIAFSITASAAATATTADAFKTALQTFLTSTTSNVTTGATALAKHTVATALALDGNGAAIPGSAITSTSTTGTIISGFDGSKVTLTSTAFDGGDTHLPPIANFSAAGYGTSTVLSVTINGVTYSTGDATVSGGRANTNGTNTLKGATFQNASGTNGSAGIVTFFKNGDATGNDKLVLDLSGINANAKIDTAGDVQNVIEALNAAFGSGGSTGGLSFQLGTGDASTVAVTIGSAKSTDLFGVTALDISTQVGATAANTAVTAAINTITSVRAGVGALESRFNFASAALQSGVQNQDAARGQLLDTDIAAESTSYATQQVKLQAGISVLAQANQQLQALLKLIG